MLLNEMDTAVTIFAEEKLGDPKDIEGYRSQLIVYYDNRLKNSLKDYGIDDSEPGIKEKIVKRRDSIIESICRNKLR